MRNIIFSLIHSLGAPWILRKTRIKNREICVLMFHRISDEYDPLWQPMPVKSFRFLMKELSSKAQVISLQDIKKIDRYPNKPLVALSFDDGYMDFWENAVPILADFGLPAHHNICPNLIDKKMPPWTQILNIFIQSNRNKDIDLPNGKNYKIRKKLNHLDIMFIYRELSTLTNESRNNWINSLTHKIPESKITKLMDWDQIRKCAKLGIHIGSHGMNHENISKIEDENILLSEIEDSKKRICKETGIEPLIFAFPKGLYNPLSMKFVKKSGYKIALLCGDMVTRFPENRKDFYILPRINICRSNWKEENLRLLGLHQKLKSWVRKTPYVLDRKD